MYQYECFYSRINPSIIGTQTEHRYKGEGSYLGTAKAQHRFWAININNEIIMDEFKCSFLIKYRLFVENKKVYIKDIFLEINPLSCSS